MRDGGDHPRVFYTKLVNDLAISLHGREGLKMPRRPPLSPAVNFR